MKRLTKEDKLKAARRYFEETISYRYLAHQVGVDHSALRYWVKLYKYHGDQAFSFPYTNYSSDFKLKVIQFMDDEGYSIREASALFHIPDYSMVRRWLEKWQNGGLEALESKRKGKDPVSQNKNPKAKKSFNSVEEELEYLRMENAYLKKLKALVEEEDQNTKGKKHESSSN